MQRTRSLLYLLGAVVVAVVVLYVDRPDRERVGVTGTHLLFPNFDPDAITTLEIDHLLDGVTLTRGEHGWTVQGRGNAMSKQLPHEQEKSVEKSPSFRADAERVAEALQKIADVSVGAAVSRKRESRNKLGVGAVALQVQAKNSAGKVVAYLYIGKSGPDFFSNYVRVDGSDEVYLAGGRLRGAFPTMVSDWRDKKVWRLDPAEISSIKLTRKEDGFTLAKTATGAWELTAPEVSEQKGAIDQDKVSGWITRWNEITATEFLDNREIVTGLDKPSIILEVGMTDGSSRTLKIGQDTSEGLPYGAVSSNSEVFVLPSGIRSALEISWEEWLRPDHKTDDNADNDQN